LLPSSFPISLKQLKARLGREQAVSPQRWWARKGNLGLSQLLSYLVAWWKAKCSGTTSAHSLVQPRSYLGRLWIDCK